MYHTLSRDTIYVLLTVTYFQVILGKLLRHLIYSWMTSVCRQERDKERKHLKSKNSVLLQTKSQLRENITRSEVLNFYNSSTPPIHRFSKCPR